MALVVALTALLAGGLGGGIVAIRSHAAEQGPAGGPAVSAAAAPTAPAAATTSQVQAALAKISPSIVDITTAGGGEGGFFGGGGSSGAGTGVITGSNEVVTNAHVVAGASSIRVQIPGRNGAVPATVVGSDSSVDLAVLRLQGVSGLPAAAFAATSTVHVGDPVLAVGNAEGFGGSPTVTEGIISALNRDLPADQGTGALRGLLQTDAAINPGNSGGALVDTAGRVIGITNAVAAGSRGQPAQNIGFAIPTDTVMKSLPALRAGRNAGGGQGNQAAPTAFLGVELSDSGQGGGALVGAVGPGTPAAGAGLRPGDVITGADGTTVGGATDLRSVIARHKPGDKITLTWRPNGQGQTRSATVTLASRSGTS